MPPPSPCPGETVTFTGTATGGSGTYAPFSGAGRPVRSRDGVHVDSTADRMVDVALTVIDDVGCENTATVNLASFDNPSVEAGDTLVLCNNDAVTEPLTGYSPGLTEAVATACGRCRPSGTDSFTQRVWGYTT